MAVTKINQTVKRAFDLIGTLLILLLLSPLLIIIALAIKITSPGAVLFKQLRLGLNGEIFWMYKFRSMVPNAVNMGSGMFVEKDDPRITAVGKLLRKTSLDELPQLLNILRGEMSLVGPRPAPLHHLKIYDERQIKRLTVKPGITGWAQVKGRLALYWPQRIELDLWYIDNYSFWLDIKILVMTVTVVLFRRGDTAKADRKENDPFMKL
ncbi:exopolysaccharide biosynthesis polyprenyl glycosylphosphotransferase [Desulfotomaculum arcticum]|uniref:Exopolysaccharide biosynthesis polyprenyl glycosylphosphotransferase n=1 Tax=Desulfotruncus arcticus DSM 17038 TaxID=1121424 RepID=A0A1I2VJD0_9FIRM|nr:sugar transferase [Desulfotruncus arcticus]SFG89388.1 exopolysaccharide biosynthesis polyprenyl glycosylphosphotransferase [Desulfotomaculum arcticum] [Desulfotruncus arcticus DSM 17038]